MKNILIIRHGKAELAEEGIDDFTRTLNKKGKEDSDLIGKTIAQLSLTPDMIISSPAKRAVNTAEHVAKKSNYKNELQIEKDLYPGDSDKIINIIKNLDNKINRVAIIGHNPSLEDLAAKLLSSGSVNILLTTASLLAIQCSTELWQEISPESSSLRLLITPKALKTQ